jgi:hypothetical protein
MRFLTWQMSQSGGGIWAADEDDEGWSSEKRRCFPASLLARCTRRSQASQSAASSAQQNTEAASAAHTSHCTFMVDRLTPLEDVFVFLPRSPRAGQWPLLQLYTAGTQGWTDGYGYSERWWKMLGWGSAFIYGRREAIGALSVGD